MSERDSDFDRCEVCQAAPGTIIDPHLGEVCAECYLDLVYARGFMQRIGPLLGIGPCRKEIPR